MQRIVIVRDGDLDTFMGWAETKRRAAYLADGEFYTKGDGSLWLLCDVRARDVRHGTGQHRGHELPAFVIEAHRGLEEGE